ncbi:hypothetical protein N9J83_02725 [Opitutales bacterium]|nr:hypothetical protein [Opitutales bacterium]
MRDHVAYQFFFDPKRDNPWSIKLGLLPKLIYSSRFGSISGGGDGGKIFGGGGGGGRSSKSVCPSEPLSVFCSFPELSPPDESGELPGEAGEVDDVDGTPTRGGILEPIELPTLPVVEDDVPRDLEKGNMLGAEDLMPGEVDVEGLNVEELDDDRLLYDGREETRLANQSGNFGADLGLAGITFLFPLEVDETLDGNFILGNPVTLGELMGEDFDCSRLKVKSCPLKARVKVSLSRSKACALYSS